MTLKLSNDDSKTIEREVFFKLFEFLRGGKSITTVEAASLFDVGSVKLGNILRKNQKTFRVVEEPRKRTITLK